MLGRASACLLRPSCQAEDYHPGVDAQKRVPTFDQHLQNLKRKLGLNERTLCFIAIMQIESVTFNLHDLGFLYIFVEKFFRWNISGDRFRIRCFRQVDITLLSL